MKSCQSHEKMKQRTSEPYFSPIDLAFWCFWFSMWCAKFQILISEQQRIWRKLLVLSWLYESLCKKMIWVTFAYPNHFIMFHVHELNRNVATTFFMSGGLDNHQVTRFYYPDWYQALFFRIFLSRDMAVYLCANCIRP